MKKKLIAAITATTLVLGVGTIAMANSENDVLGNFNFHEMLPFMQKMHPDMNEEQLEEMFNRCSSSGGMMNGNMDEMMNKSNQEMKNMMKNKMGTDL